MNCIGISLEVATPLIACGFGLVFLIFIGVIFSNEDIDTEQKVISVVMAGVILGFLIFWLNTAIVTPVGVVPSECTGTNITIGN